MKIEIWFLSEFSAADFRLWRLGDIGWAIHHVKHEWNFGGWERCTFEKRDKGIYF